MKINAVARLSASSASPLTKQQIKDCKLAKKLIDEFLKSQPKMSAEDTAKVMTVVLDLRDLNHKVNWP